MFESLGGLPAHPLVVHLPVVLVPLAAIGALLMAIRPAWLQRFGVVVATLAGLGFVGSLLAAGSGEELEDSFRAAGETISGALHDHAEMGESVELLAGLFFVLVLAWVLFAAWRRKVGEEHAVARVRRPKVVAIVLALLVVLSGFTATASVYLTGHSGAKSVWEDTAP